MLYKKCSFTGHRPKRLPFGSNEEDPQCISLKEKLKCEIELQISKNGVGHFISGMALGVDTYCAEIVIEMKKEHPDIILEAAIPCKDQAVKWRRKDKERICRF